MKTKGRDEILGKLKDRPGRTLLIDVRDREDYEAEHIRGALSIPITELTMRAAKSFDKDREIIVYCQAFDCPLSAQAAKVLDRMGFTDVVDYEGGLNDWKEAGYPTESRESAKAA